MNITEYIYTPLGALAITAFGMLVVIYIGIKLHKFKLARARTAYYDNLLETQRKRKLPPKSADPYSGTLPHYDVWYPSNPRCDDDSYANYVETE